MTWEREEIGSCTLYRGDCRDVLPTLGLLAAVVTDFPYGVELKIGRRHGQPSGTQGQLRTPLTYQKTASIIYCDTREVVCGLIHDVMPIIVAQSHRAAVFCGRRLIHEFPAAASIGCVYVPSGSGCDAWGFGSFNPILFYGACPYLEARRGSHPNSFLEYNPTTEAVDHPCPKPLNWMRWLVNRASLTGEIVVDPLMGSGTTGVACVQLGRRFVGIEIEPRYFDLACQRIEEAQRQGDLFVAPTPRRVVQEVLL